jgi:hypothetical protein
MHQPPAPRDQQQQQHGQSEQQQQQQQHQHRQFKHFLHIFQPVSSVWYAFLITYGRPYVPRVPMYQGPSAEIHCFQLTTLKGCLQEK